MMPKIRALTTFGVVAVPVCLSSPSFGWWWQEKTNNVKVWETCVKENLSFLVDVAVIRKKCIEKHATAVPVNKITVVKEPAVTDFAFNFSAEDFLLTSVSLKAFYDNRENSVVADTDRPSSSLRYVLPDGYARCGAYRTPSCVDIEVISAKGFKIAFE